MYPVTLVIIIAIGILIFLVPRRMVVLLILIGACYFTGGQVIIISSIEFYVSRILILCGIFRILFKREHLSIKMTDIDKVVVVMTICMIVTGVLLEKNFGALINRVGRAIDTFCAFMIFRVSISDLEDVKRLMKGIVVAFIPLSLSMIIEQLTGINIFGIFGGVSEYAIIRDGQIRSTASFPHPILAGTVGGIHLPLVISMIRKFEKNRFMIAGVVVCSVMVITSASSGPLMTVFIGLFALSLWRFRESLNKIILAGIVMLFVLSVFMQSPVWYLIAKIDLTGSSTGWHRAELISSAINHLNEWWLIGTNYTRHWMPTGVTWSPNHTDITNYYIAWGVIGGLPTLIPFILIIILSFKGLGKVLVYYSNSNNKNAFIVWAIGAMLFAHTITFFSVSYWDQIELFWNLHIAITSSLYAYVRAREDSSLPLIGRLKIDKR